MINRIAGKRFPGFQNPVNPVILSKAHIEIRQTGIGTKPLNTIGGEPAKRHKQEANAILAAKPS